MYGAREQMCGGRRLCRVPESPGDMRGLLLCCLLAAVGAQACTDTKNTAKCARKVARKPRKCLKKSFVKKEKCSGKKAKVHCAKSCDRCGE